MKSNKYPILINWKDYPNDKKKCIFTRPINNNFQKISNNVKKIFNQVICHGDNALIKFNESLDHIKIKQLKISHTSFIHSGHNLSKKIKKAIRTAAKNIYKYHQMQIIPKIKIQTTPGIYCQQITRPLNTVGLYIPGGKAPLLSTVMMLGIPARIAQCKRIILCSPPPIPEVIIYTAKICGIKEIYQVGGSQAIAAMGFGTESIPKVNKIFGPGNVWVTEAKRQIRCRPDGTDIDMLAGPSEVLIIADNTANPVFIAADLLSQAEHGPDSQTILITPDINIITETKKELYKQLQNLPRKNIINQSLQHSYMIIANNILECFSISNYYAPEHLIIQIKNATHYLKNITNAGSIFLGNWSPESAGDYASGPNHVLPTYGQSINTSGLGVIDFQKRISVQKLSKNGLLKLSSTITTLAQIETLKAHEYAITHRINYIKKENNEHTIS